MQNLKNGITIEFFEEILEKFGIEIDVKSQNLDEILKKKHLFKLNFIPFLKLDKKF